MTTRLIDTALGADDMGVDDTAVLDALCEAETALARACAQAGLIELATALEIAAACDVVCRGDLDELARRSVAGGNPVIPLVEQLRAVVREHAGADAARAVHLGATSQDILDTALMLIAKRVLGRAGAGLAAAGDVAARLAREHRATPMAARTLLQQAMPTTFGALAVTWARGLDVGAARVRALADGLPVQFGGAVGTLAALHPHGPRVRAAMADELGLTDPDHAWHADRTVVTDIAGVLGGASAAVHKVATDLVLLAQSEVGEVHERTPGGSSAMAHKQNPIAAVTARAAAAQVPGLVATVLAAAAPELQRGAGTWHAEWPALLGMLRYGGGAVARLQVALDIDVDAESMARNLIALGEVTGEHDLAAAHAVVDDYLEGRTR